MMGIYDTYEGTSFYTLHYTYSDMPNIECEHAPLELSEARELYNDYVKNPRYTKVYATKDNIVARTSIQLSSAALLEKA